MDRDGQAPIERVLVVLNPSARHGVAAGLKPALLAETDTRTGWRLAVTAGPGDAGRWAATAPDIDAVLAVGGDGTVHEVVNGLMARPETERPALAVLPSGSGDDYAAMLHLPRSVSDCRRLIEVGKTRRLDVGECNGAWFMNSLSLGLDARVTAYVTGLKKKTRQTGLPLYFRGLFHVLFKDYRMHDLTVTLDDSAPRAVTVMLMAAGIGPTYGGGFRIVPRAVPDDGLLDVLLIDAVPLTEALWRLPFVVTGHHLDMKPVHLARARRVLVRSSTPLPGQFDGEPIESCRYDITLHPRALRVVVA